MDSTTKKQVAIAIIVCFIVVAGALYAYVPNERYDSRIDVDGGVLTYEVTSSRAVQHAIILLDNSSYSAIDTLYIYKDSGFKTRMSDSNMSYFYERLDITLKVKGFDNIKYVNANELYDILEETSAGKGLLIPTGAIPIVHNSDDDVNSILDWVKKGGTLYWTYGVIGNYVSYPDRLVESEYYNVLINENVMFSGSKYGKNDDQYGARLLFSLEQYMLTNAPIENTITDSHKCFGFNDGNAYSITSIQKELGQICIFSGTIDRMNTMQLRDLATIVGSGLSCFTDMTKIQSNTGSFSGTLRGTFDVTGYGQNSVVYINLGGNYSVYSARHVVF